MNKISTLTSLKNSLQNALKIESFLLSFKQFDFSIDVVGDGAVFTPHVRGSPARGALLERNVFNSIMKSKFNYYGCNIKQHD